MIITGSAKAKTDHGAAGISFLAPTGRCLFLKRSAKSDHPGTWCWPGGGIEEGETPEQAAKREATEEVGIPAEDMDGEMSLLDEREGFTTFRYKVEHQFVPGLNDEHDDFKWALPEEMEGLHPGVEKTLKKIGQANDEMPLALRQHKLTAFAFDKSSVRTTDLDGKLHVARSNISKANICPYLGREIPDFEELGLDPNKIYKLLRHPEEIAKGAATFNNLPILDKHVPVSSEDHQPDLVIGSTGTDAAFEGQHLSNSLVFWAQSAIDDIESEARKELSSAYRYRADMTPGNFLGEKYDGVMRDIIGNHVALVKEGRVGSDVVVCDAKISTSMENINMAKTLLSRKAVLLMGATAAFLQPKLAADAQIDLGSVFKGITGKNLSAKKVGLVKSINKMVKGKLATDASVEGLVELIDALEPTVIEGADADPLPQKLVDDADLDDEDDVDAADAGDPNGPVKEFLKGKLSAEDMAACDALFGGAKKGMDEPPPFAGAPKPGAKDADPDDKPVPKKAMDAAIKVAADAAAKLATDAANKNAREIRDAERFVAPWVGELAMAHDSAEAVLRTAAGALNIEGHEDIHVSALKTVIGMQPKPGEGKKPSTTADLGMDEASAKSFADRFSAASRIKTV